MMLVTLATETLVLNQATGQLTNSAQTFTLGFIDPESDARDIEDYLRDAYQLKNWKVLDTRVI